MANYLPMFKNQEAHDEYFTLYDSYLKTWPVEYEIAHVATEYGETRVIISGDGNNPPLVLLHGTSATSLMWMPNIAALSAQYRVYALDTIGDVGRTKTIKPFKNKNEAAGWLDLVLDKLKITGAYVAGMSYGSFLGLNLAVLKPGRIRKLVLISPVQSFVPLKLVFWIKFIKLMINPTRKSRMDFLKWNGGNKEIVESELTEMMFTAMKYANYYISPTMKTIFSKADLAAVTIPVLLLIGDKEVLVDVTRLLKKAQAGIQKLTVRVVPDASHTLSGEKPEIVNNCILEFLNEH